MISPAATREGATVTHPHTTTNTRAVAKIEIFTIHLPVNTPRAGLRETRTRGATSYPVGRRTVLFYPLASKILVASNWANRMDGRVPESIPKSLGSIKAGSINTSSMSTNVTLQFAPTLASALQPFCDGLCTQSRCTEWGIPHADFEHILLTVGAKYLVGTTQADDAAAFFKSLKVEELALARGCAAGHERAWEVFLTRYREKLFEMALSIARDGATARELADSLYADLYGVNSRGERVSKLASYTGRGSLEGWLRTVLAQEFVNRYRKQRRTTSLDEEVEQGRQFAALPQETAAADAGLADLQIDPRLDQSIASVLDSLTS